MVTLIVPSQAAISFCALQNAFVGNRRRMIDLRTVLVLHLFLVDYAGEQLAVGLVNNFVQCICERGKFGSSPEVSVISSKSSILSLPLHEHHPLHYFSLFSALLLELTHVQVAPSRLPFLRLLDAQRRHQPEARLAVGEDPHHPTAALYLLVEPLLAVGRADAPLVALGKARQVRHSSMCSSRCSATFLWLRPRHFWAISEARARACALLVAAKIALRSAPSSLRLARPTMPSRFLA